MDRVAALDALRRARLAMADPARQGPGRLVSEPPARTPHPPRQPGPAPIDPDYQTVAVGDRVADYGRDGWFEARVVDPPHALVWWSERGKDLRLTWALVLAATGPDTSELHVRLRINRALGRQLPAIVQWGAELFDRFTVSDHGRRPARAAGRRGGAAGSASARSRRFSEHE